MSDKKPFMVYELPPMTSVNTKAFSKEALKGIYVLRVEKRDGEFRWFLTGSDICQERPSQNLGDCVSDAQKFWDGKHYIWDESVAALCF